MRFPGMHDLIHLTAHMLNTMKPDSLLLSRNKDDFFFLLNFIKAH